MTDRFRDTLRGHLAWIIADTPGHNEDPLDELLVTADAILDEFFVVRRRSWLFGFLVVWHIAGMAAFGVYAWLR